jgi:hypothetical protein
MKDVVIKKNNIVRRWNRFVDKVSPFSDIRPNKSYDTCSFFWNTIFKTVATLLVYVICFIVLSGLGASVVKDWFEVEFYLGGLTYFWFVGSSTIAVIVAAALALVVAFVGITTVAGKASDAVGTTGVIKHIKNKTCARIRYED